MCLNDLCDLPLRLYSIRWNIETNYYEQKTFWNLGNYRVCKENGILHMLNFLNRLHALMKLLPYSEPCRAEMQ